MAGLLMIGHKGDGQIGPERKKINAYIVYIKSVVQRPDSPGKSVEHLWIT